MSPRSWIQQTFLPAEAVEAVLRIGVVGAGDHAQVQLEVRDATSGELLAMEATPHVRLSRIDEVTEQTLHRLLSIVAEYVGPF